MLVDVAVAGGQLIQQLRGLHKVRGHFVAVFLCLLLHLLELVFQLAPGLWGAAAALGNSSAGDAADQQGGNANGDQYFQ